MAATCPDTSWTVSIERLIMALYSCEAVVDTAAAIPAPMSDPVSPSFEDRRNEVTEARLAAAIEGGDI